VATVEDTPSILFVKRGERAGDPWSGHVAFPGGFRSPVDESAAATAMRETKEETGLDLERLGESLGPLDDVYPRSVRLPKVIVTPVVFLVAGRPAVSARAEVDRAEWIEAAEVFDPDNQRPYVLHTGESQLVFESIQVRGLTIWGLTERILSQVANII